MKFSNGLKLSALFTGGAIAALLSLNSHAGKEEAVPSVPSMKDLSGGVLQAPVQTVQAVQGQSLASELGLPVGKPAYYFNRATNTAFRESCTVAGENSASCTLDVLGLTAQIAHTLHTDYERGPSGALTVQSRKGSVQEWSQNLSSTYRSFREQAVSYQWNADSPLALKADNTGRDLIQNNVYQVALLGQKGVSLCSTQPVNERRGFDVCISFDQAAYQVSSAALPRVAATSSLPGILTNPAAAAREYNRYDGEHFDIYRQQISAGKSSALVMRRD